MSSLIRTLPREVVLRFVRADSIPADELDRLGREFLDAGELRAVARLRPEGVRRDYAAAHVLARAMLAERIGAHPAELRFKASARGRPEIVAPRGAGRWRFSLSHADGVALCAVSAGYALGADVESLRSVGGDPDGVAATICSEAELESLVSVPPKLRPDRLLLVWTIKEALAKASGRGLGLPLREITVRGTPPRVEVTGFGRSGWCFASFRLPPHHVGAVAVHEGGGRPARLEPPLPMTEFDEA